MISAIVAYREKRLGYFKSAQSTLESYVKMDKNPEDIFGSKLGRKVVFSEQMEAMLAENTV